MKREDYHSETRRPSNPEADKQLLLAFKFQNLEAFQDALESGANPNSQLNDMPVLLSACSAPSPEFLFALLKHPDIKINAVDANGNTALELAKHHHPTSKAAIEETKAAIEFSTMRRWPSEIWGEDGIAGFLDNKSLAALRLTSTYLSEAVKYPFLKRLRSSSPHITMSFLSVFYLWQGKLYAWGDNDQGQLGLANNDNQNTPQAVLLPEGELAAQIFKNGSSIFCLTQSGHLYAWGENNSGQLGLGLDEHQNTPQRICLSEEFGRSLEQFGSPDVTINMQTMRFFHYPSESKPHSEDESTTTVDKTKGCCIS